MAAQLGRESAADIVSNFSSGFNNESGSVQQTRQSNIYMIPGTTTINIPFEVNNRIVKEFSFTMDELRSEGRL